MWTANIVSVKGDLVFTRNEKNELKAAAIILIMDGLPSAQYKLTATIQTLDVLSMDQAEEQERGWTIGVRSSNYIVEHDSRGSLHPRKHVFEVLSNCTVINKTWPPGLSVLQPML